MIMRMAGKALHFACMLQDRGAKMNDFQLDFTMNNGHGL